MSANKDETFRRNIVEANAFWISTPDANGNKEVIDENRNWKGRKLSLSQVDLLKTFYDKTQETIKNFTNSFRKLETQQKKSKKEIDHLKKQVKDNQETLEFHKDRYFTVTLEVYLMVNGEPMTSNGKRFGDLSISFMGNHAICSIIRTNSEGISRRNPELELSVADYQGLYFGYEGLPYLTLKNTETSTINLIAKDGVIKSIRLKNSKGVIQENPIGFIVPAKLRK